MSLPNCIHCTIKNTNLQSTLLQYVSVCFFLFVLLFFCFRFFSKENADLKFGIRILPSREKNKQTKKKQIYKAPRRMFFLFCFFVFLTCFFLIFLVCFKEYFQFSNECMPLDVLTLYMVPSGYKTRCENQAQRPSFQRNITNFGTQSV